MSYLKVTFHVCEDTELEEISTGMGGGGNFSGETVGATLRK